MLLQEKLADIPIVLGSKSPRRRELLRDMDLQFDVQVRETDESFEPGLSPETIVKNIAEAKLAQFANELEEDKLVICADTIVVNPQGRVLGKPTDPKQAIEMIQELAGHKHDVLTGVVIGYRDLRVSFVERTSVWLSKLNPAEISFYVEKYRPLDKAGAYGIQEWIGRIGVVRIEGAYENVIGLPTARLQQELKKIFLQ